LPVVKKARGRVGGNRHGTSASVSPLSTTTRSLTDDDEGEEMSLDLFD